MQTGPGRTAATGGRPADRTAFLPANAVTIGAGTLAVVLAASIWFGLPHEREIDSIWVLLFKLTPFAAAAVAIAWLDPGWAHRLRLALVLIPASFLMIFCGFVPRVFFYRSKPGTEHYYTILALVPFLILALVLAYRLGGGPRSTTLRLCTALIVLQLSGIEDLAFLATYTEGGWAALPEVWEAPHIAVRIGHQPSKAEALAFIAGHVVLAVAVLTVPGRAVRALAGRSRGRRASRD